MIVRDAPTGTVPSAQGNGVAQAPAFETNVRFGGVGSATTTAAASEGPLFVTTSV